MRLLTICPSKRAVPLLQNLLKPSGKTKAHFAPLLPHLFTSGFRLLAGRSRSPYTPTPRRYVNNYAQVHTYFPKNHPQHTAVLLHQQHPRRGGLPMATRLLHAADVHPRDAEHERRQARALSSHVDTNHPNA